MDARTHVATGGRWGMAARALAAGALVAAGLDAPIAEAQAPIDADIEVVKTGTPAVARVGDDITFTVVATNNGPDPVASVVLADQPPAVAIADVSWTCTSSAGVTCPVSGGTGTAPIRLVFQMPAEESLTVTIEATVVGIPPGGRIANQASVSSQDPGFLDTNPFNNFSQAAIPVADLGVVKTATPTAVGPGDVVSYSLALTNPGGGVYAGAVVEDDLSDVLDVATYNDDATATSGTVSFADPVLTWTGDVPAGGTVTVTYSVTIDVPIGGDGVMTNVVVSDGGNCPEGSTDPDCTTEVTPTTTTTTTTTSTTTPTTSTTAPTTAAPTTVAPSSTPPPSTPPPSDVGPAATSAGAASSAPGGAALPTTGVDARLLALGLLLAGLGLLVLVHGARRISG